MKLLLFIMLTITIVFCSVIIYSYYYYETINLRKEFSLWSWKQEKKILIKRLSGYNRLQPHHLTSLGFVYAENGYYFQPNIKDRDRISVEFVENGYGYRVYHSKSMTFIAAENTLEWFETYYLLIHPDNRTNP